MSLDSNNIAHLEECPGCDRCESLMAFYQTCDRCHQWGHNDAMYIASVTDGRAEVSCHSCMSEKELATFREVSP